MIRHIFIAAALTVLLTAGCPAPVTTLQKGGPAKPAITSPANSYYLFTQAQIEKEKGSLDSATAWMTRAVAADPDSAYLKRELAILFLMKKENDRARQTVEQLLAVHPDDVDGQILLAGILHHQGDLQGAARLYEQALENAPDQEGLYLVLGNLYTEQGQMESAAGVYEKMTRHFPDLWDGHFFLGNTRKEMGLAKEAEASYKTAIRLNPEALSPRFALLDLYERQTPATGPVTVTVTSGDTLFSLCRQVYGDCSRRLLDRIAAANPVITDMDRLNVGQTLQMPPREGAAHNRRQVIGLYTDLLRDNPDNYRAAFGLALHHHAAGDVDAALKILKPLGPKSDETPGVLQPLFQYYIDRGKYPEAEILVNGMLAGAPDSSALNYLMGMVQDQRENKEEAIRFLSRVDSKSRFYDNARFHMALLHQSMGNTGQAIEILSARVNDEPDNVDHLLRLGVLYEEKEEYGKAEDLFERGLAIAPDHVELLFRLGVIYDKTDRKEALITQMEKVIEIDPNNAGALNYLGYTYAEKGENLDQAQALIEKALALQPDDGYITDSLGWVYFKKGNVEKAVYYLEAAVNLVPDDPVLLEHLGDAYREQGNTEKALEMYRRSLASQEKDTTKIKAKIEALQKELP
ncbi:MAG: tetratricopeptide repeat protein [Thermodesulfobacteriota bacterium]|nr:tetratricopeptide repeat protein [Thermodesulfobacteriota bacterium]